MQVAAELAPPHRQLTVGPRDGALKKARTCYDHLAGRLGVGLADGLLERGHIELTNDAGILTQSGTAFLAELGIDTGPLDGGPQGPVRARLVPALPRLERAPAPSRGRRRRRAVRALHAQRLDAAPRWHAGGADHAGRRALLPREAGAADDIGPAGAPVRRADRAPTGNLHGWHPFRTVPAGRWIPHDADPGHRRC